jgi:ankyrin repeat protein
LLLENGEVNVNSKDIFGRTLLSYAAQKGYEATIKLLLKNGVDVDSKDNNDWTPLLYTAKNGHFAVIVLLLENGVKADSKTNGGMFYKAGQTSLWLAAQNGHEAIVKLLLDTGKVHSDSKDLSGRTPLLLATLRPINLL